MALTKISTDGVKDDAITKAKIPANQIEASELANNAVDTNAIADQAVTLDKLPHGDANNDGKFLRANNGADPSFETVSIPASVGGANGVDFNDNVKARFGTNNDLEIKHDGSDSLIKDTGTGSLVLTSNDVQILNAAQNEYMIRATENAAVQLFQDGSLKLNTESDGININGASFDTHIKFLGNKFLSRSRWGYSTGYSGVTLGRTDVSNNSTIFMGVDVSGNASGVFTGDGREVVFRNNHRFVIPNAANNGYLASMHLNGGAATEGVPKFPQGILVGNNTANENILDDYEEGTWTPSNVNFHTYSNIVWDARYTKIGNVVHLFLVMSSGNIDWNAGQQLTGLPFSVASTGCGNWTNNAPSDGGECLIWNNGYLYFSQAHNGGATHNLRLTATYRTN